MSSLHDAVQHLLDIKQLFEQGYWIQGAYMHTDVEGKTSYCLSGALDFYGDFSKWSPARAIARNLVYKALDVTGYGMIPAFNDEPGRTVTDVIDVIGLAIKQASK